jgi:hypothetical protein
MAPNGMMLVWTGLLLRMENEAQLAFVLGHETGHYLRRHLWQRFRDASAKSSFLQVLSIAMHFAAAAAGVPLPELGASGAQLGAGFATLGSVYAFSRDGEREADEIGFELMVRAGYDPREAPQAWDRLMAEARASGTSRPPLFFATHPPLDERVTTLEQLTDRAAQGAGEGRVARDEYRQHLAPIRRLLLRDEIRRREFAATEVLLRRLVEDGVGLGEVHFFRGEMHRLRSVAGDLAEAVTAYRRALEFPDAPPETHRNLGLLLARTEGRVEAGEALVRYLEQRPDAEDREMIKSQIDELARQP